jgi:aerobic carbon-monoxide dehydrogenase large subunit
MPDGPGRVAAGPGMAQTAAGPGTAQTAAGPGMAQTAAGPGMAQTAAGPAAPETAPAGRWIGVPVRRTEDPYLLTGRGSFVGDHEPPGTLHLALVRSYAASAAIDAIDTSAALSHPGVAAVITAADLAGVAPLRGVLARPEFVATDMPILAGDRVRHVGEPIAAVLAESAYLAEDAAELVEVAYRELPAVVSAGDALAAGAPAVHEAAAGNVLLDVSPASSPGLDGLFAAAAHVVEIAVSTGRLTAAPMEGRACVAAFDERTGQVVLHTSTQVPHIVRTAVAASLGMDEHQVRVISPDVGGGFGQKCAVAREEVLAAAVARLLCRTVKWVEDRREGLTSGFQAREQVYRLRGAFDEAGHVLGIDAGIDCDVGAYSCYPYTCGVEALMAANELPGPYRVRSYRVRSRAIATNKTPIAPYRGVSRPQAVLAMERLMDAAGRATGLGPVAVRDRNLIAAPEFPYVNVMGTSYDAGSYRESLARCADLLGYATWPGVQARARAEGRLAGLGLACFVEPTGYGTGTFGKRKMSIVPGYERATVRMDPSGSVIMMVGTHSHGQGHATTYAQIVADALGIDPGRVRLRQGDTELVPHGWGTFASRSIVAGGGALARAAADLAGQLKAIAAHLIEAAPGDVELADGRAHVRGDPATAVPIGELARTAHHAAHLLPEQLGRGLEATASFDPEGTYSNATHGAVVEVSPSTGAVRLVRYVVVEDCGVMINPMIVDGQVAGGVAQGIGAALFEELCFDPAGQPVSASFVDYLVPTAADLPDIEIHHLCTPTPRTPTGSKGMGEGGTIGAPAAVLNAVNDALAQVGALVERIPVRPEDILAAIAAAGGGRGECRRETE